MQGIHVNIDEDTKYPWRHKKYPNIEQGTQTDPPAPYPRSRNISTFDAGRYIPPPPTLETDVPRRTISAFNAGRDLQSISVDKKDASTQLQYNELMFKLYQLMAKETRNEKIKNLLHKIGVDWNRLLERITNYPDFYEEFHRMVDEMYHSPTFHLGEVESPSPNTKAAQKHDFTRRLLERMTKLYMNEEERMVKYRPAPYYFDKKRS